MCRLEFHKRMEMMNQSMLPFRRNKTIWRKRQKSHHDDDSASNATPTLEQQQQQQDQQTYLNDQQQLSVDARETIDNSREPPHPVETPKQSPPPKPSRFVFLSDQKSVPTDMKKLQERTIKRRRELLAKMHNADCHLASLTAKYAEEKMDMDLAIRDSFQRNTARPLTESMQRLSMMRDAAGGMNAVTHLERRVKHLDASMMHHANVTLSDMKRDELESFHDDLQQDVMSEIRVETSTFDKVESGIVRRFEEVAGEIAKDFHSEGAARRAEMAVMKEKVERKIPEQNERILEDALAKIASLRAQIRQEKADRQAADQAILDSIVANTAAMKRAMMALVSDGELG